MSKKNPLNPRRGEVWEVNLDPTFCSETRKILPAVVISSDSLEYLTTRLIIPISTSRDHSSDIIWIVPIKPNDNNGLIMDSIADTTLTLSVDFRCFIRQLGRLEAPIILEIVAAMAAVIELQ